MTSPSSGTSPAPRQPVTRPPRRRSAEIDVDEARKAFFLMVGFIGVIWILQIANWADRYGLDFSYGILPRSLGHLGYIFIAPFLHFSWNHIEGNSGPLFVFGFLAAYRGVVKFLGVTLVVALTSGLAVWLFQGNSELTVGASGLIFGYFGYVLTRGIIERNLIDALAAVVIGLSYAYILTGFSAPGAAACPAAARRSPRPVPGLEHQARNSRSDRAIRGPTCTRNSTTWACRPRCRTTNGGAGSSIRCTRGASPTPAQTVSATCEGC